MATRSAMLMKKRGREPTYGAVIADNPNATRNPQTGEPVSKHVVSRIFAERCFDDPDKPDDTWSHHSRCSKDALTPPQMLERLA